MARTRIVLAIFFYLDGRLVLVTFNLADDGLLRARSKVQIPTEVGIIQRGNAAHEFVQYLFVDGRAGEVQHLVEGGLPVAIITGRAGGRDSKAPGPRNFLSLCVEEIIKDALF